MSRFYLDDSDEADPDYNDILSEDALPFPKPLARSAFLDPNFDPATFLSSLSDRHQTLGDLQNELRELNQSLNREILDLVNDNYQDFLSLGTALKGGDEKVEEVRVGLLGFQKDVGAIREEIGQKSNGMRNLLNEKKSIRSDIAVAHDLLDVAESIDELEHQLMLVKSSIGNEAESDQESTGLSDIDSDYESENASSDQNNEGRAQAIFLKKLERHIHRYLYTLAVMQRVGTTHPFLVQQESRMSKIRSTLLLDLRTAQKQALSQGDSGKHNQSRVIKLYRSLGEEPALEHALQTLSIS